MESRVGKSLSWGSLPTDESGPAFERTATAVIPGVVDFMKFGAHLATILTASLALSSRVRAADPDWTSVERDALRLQAAEGLQVRVWAAEPQFFNGVAFSFDERGRCYIAETHRYGRSVFDITQQTNWLAHDLSFRTTDDRKTFLLEEWASDPTRLTRDSELVRRLDDPGNTGRVTSSEIVAQGFNSVLDGTAAGILARQNQVWFGNIPTLWKLETAEGTQGRKPLASGFGVHIGVTGHDLHGLILGPDGRIYLSFGDRGLHLTNSLGETIDLPDTGGVLRCETDGSHLEVFCSGLRNPQELAFDDQGNLWTVDNDTAGADPCRLLFLIREADYGWRCSYQHQDGFGPWVGEELWKGGRQGILPPCGTVSQGPSGLAWYPGTGFGRRLAGKFLHCDFPQGVTAFSVVPRGAGFTVGEQERFLWNCWPTDVDFGPDGAAYVLDWVGGWQMPDKGRIYRITDPSQEGSKEIAEVRTLLGGGMSQTDEATLATLLAHRDQRVRLAAQFEVVRRGVGELKLLVQAACTQGPQFGRLHALWALGQLSRRSAHDLDAAAAIPALEGLAEDADREVAGQSLLLLAELEPQAVLGAASRALKKPSPRLRLQAALALAEAARSSRSSAEASRSAFDGSGWNAILAEILGNDNPDPWIEHAVATTLSFLEQASVREGKREPSALWLSHDTPRHRRVGLLASRLRAMMAIRGGKNPSSVEETARELIPLLDDPDPELVEETARFIHEIPLADAFPALAKLLTRIDLPPLAMSRVINANFRLGSDQNAQALASFAARRAIPNDARVAALQALGEWESPSPIDRVNGLWRPLVTRPSGVPENIALNPMTAATSDGTDVSRSSVFGTKSSPMNRSVRLPDDLGRSCGFEAGTSMRRNAQAARRALLRVSAGILNPGAPDEYGVVLGGEPAPEPVQAALIAAAVRLHIREAGHALAEHFRRPATSSSIRVSIVRALAQLGSSETPGIIREAIHSSDPPIQASALPFLDRIDDADSVHFLELAVDRGMTGTGADLRLAQVALAALGRSTIPTAATLLESYLVRRNRHQWPDALLLDLLEAQRNNPFLKPPPSAAEWPWKAEKVKDRSLWRPWLDGGDAARGSLIFSQNPTVQCIRCHRVAAQGGTVGPALDRIGLRATPEELLESILFPNARLANGYASVSVTLKSGVTWTGTLREETSKEITLETTGEEGNSQRVVVPVSEISDRHSAPSAMPEGLADSLSAFDLRDLVEFLKSQK